MYDGNKPITFEEILNMFPDAREAINPPKLHKNEDFSDDINIVKVAPPPKIEK